ncbi:Mss4-like protein [Massariosphaeria phaeospora]|uniref:Mss4-like protein n=1 Tax=Massariosphaeria phaeospora TaxID=100035 RepID=A0A7C8MEK2_9PLEO|nr:Mss4-like protein [Massariosphaeria phaeospora]
MSNSKELTITCFCGAATHTFSVPFSSLPLSTHLCNCNISRRISGSLLTSYVNIPNYSPNPDLSALTPYKSSKTLTRHFCSTCGTHMYLEYSEDGHFEAATGTLQMESTDGIVDFQSHMWIEDTRDGGASQFITHINGRKLTRYLQAPEPSVDIPLEWKTASATDTHITGAQTIHAHCHCNGVEFYITPPNSSSRNAESPWPDLLVPYHTSNSDNLHNHPWWLSRHDRFLAGTCACNSCRRASGFDITFWAFIPTMHITQDVSGTLPFSRRPYWGTMKTYQSSEDATRTFCGTCGANVFWDGRESLIDVAVGLLDAESGARAEELLAWWPGRVSFEEFALNRGLVKGLEDGLKGWAERNEGREYIATSAFPVLE